MGGQPNIQNGRDGYNQSNGTEVTSTEDLPKATTTPEVTSTTAVNNNRVIWVHNLSKTL